MTIQYHHSNARMSQIAVHNGTVYLAGQVPSDATADMRGQTEQVLARIDELLAEAGSSKEHLISAQVWVTDMAEFDQMNAAWEAWVVPGRPPVRAALEAKLAKPEWKVEIMVVAALPEA
ncbi:MAG: RidA family protein [Halomonas sp.]|jgi:enamine deaminase RidA (YjgF/YER057c/UK114 family)|uniref:RidA family protein n=1 Tax=Billgrantia tianxiuensis TaxID=2497861 RepID=A0A6I6SHA5_9GAMM|nr:MULTISPECIES: RidA family protein [Halomonas]MCE8032070.1 RidA family protein [Halomonas sp. MCCC 1A11057]MDX5435496.1 RidA family protein [Halomonas sp.]MDX5504478.1 RidA family protein [Halomonas sp.]QHC49889.1 RidA family protein [Halomonas tianxiuensis]